MPGVLDLVILTTSKRIIRLTQHHNQRHPATEPDFLQRTRRCSGLLSIQSDRLCVPSYCRIIISEVVVIEIALRIEILPGEPQVVFERGEAGGRFICRSLTERPRVPASSAA